MNGFLIRRNENNLTLFSSMIIDMVINATRRGVLSIDYNILIIIRDNPGDVIYIDNEELYEKVSNLINNSEYKLIDAMFNTIKEYENEIHRDSQIKRITDALPKSLDSVDE